MSETEQDHGWIDALAAALPGVQVEYKPEWGVFLYRVAGKLFGTRGRFRDGRPIVTLKLDPELGELLRSNHDWVIPGYYSNKRHYNSVFLEEAPRQRVIELLHDAYELVVSALPRKARAALAPEVGADGGER